MENRFIPKQYIPGVMSLVSKYRSSLLAIGKSPDSHVYDYRESTFSANLRSPQRKFLRSVYRFYQSLKDETDQKIFLSEILERGRHYPFWHFGMMESSEYKQRVVRICTKTFRAFGIEVPA